MGMNSSITGKAGLLAVVVILPVMWASCSPTPGPDKSLAGAVLGAGWGAGAGAVIGHQTGAAVPGAYLGAAFGGGAGLLTGVGMDIAEGNELDQQRDIDALKVQVAANQRTLLTMQDHLDDRDRHLAQNTVHEQIFFDSDRASLRAGSAAALERFVDNLKSNPYVGQIEVHGHTDETGNSERNMRLSEARARTVATFLVEHGVSFDWIKIIPHGAQMPLASNENEAGKQLNRRVEILVKK